MNRAARFAVGLAFGVAIGLGSLCWMEYFGIGHFVKGAERASVTTVEFNENAFIDTTQIEVIR